MKHLLPALLVAALLAGCGPADDGVDQPLQPDTTLSDDLAAALATNDDPPADGAAPSLALPTLDGDTLSLTDLRGRVVLVNFWATWCAPCIREMPDLVALHDRFSDDGFTVVGVSVDAEGRSVVAPFAERQGLTYPLLLDTTGEATEAFGGVLGLPTSFLLDADGRIVRRILGLVHEDRLAPAIEELLES